MWGEMCGLNQKDDGNVAGFFFRKWNESKLKSRQFAKVTFRMEGQEFLGLNEKLDEKELQKYTNLVESEKNEESNAEAPSEQCPMTPTIVNIVACVDYGCTLNLNKIATHSRNAEYNPKRFPAVTLRIEDPKATGLAFKTGKMNIVGCNTEESAYLAARKFGRMLKLLDFKAHLQSFKIANIVATTSCHFPIHLESLATHPQHKVYATYNPEVFAGLIFRVMKPRATVLIFVSGNIVITGVKTIEEVVESSNFIYPILQLFARSSSAVPQKLPSAPPKESQSQANHTESSAPNASELQSQIKPLTHKDSSKDEDEPIESS